MFINVTECATLYPYYWLHVCTVITIHPFMLMLSTWYCFTLFRALVRICCYTRRLTETDWRRRGSQYRRCCDWVQFWKASEGKVSLHFSTKTPPNKTPSNNGSNFNTKTSASRTLSLPDELETQKFVKPVRFAVKPKMGHLVWNVIPDLPNLFCVPSSACTFVYQWKCCWSWGRQLLYISECYWALLFNSCPHCMYIFQNKMRCIYESFRSNYGTVSPTTWWELKYFCSIKFLKNTKMPWVEVCDW